jgi:hypothetical protein
VHTSSGERAPAGTIVVRIVTGALLAATAPGCALIADLPEGVLAPGGGDGYAAEVLADGPVAYWRLDDTDPTSLYDRGPNGYHGHYEGAVELGEPEIFPGAQGRSVRFGGGSGDLAVVGGDVLDFAGTVPLSIELWVRPGDIAGSLVSKATYDGTDYQGWLLVLRQENTPDFMLSETVGAPSQVSNEAFTHVVGTYDGTTGRVYQDGTEIVARSLVSVLPDTTEPIRIGSHPSWGSFDGWIDEIALYDKALPPDRVKAHYQAAVPP